MKPGPASLFLLLALGGCVAEPPLVPATPLEERETTEFLGLLERWKPPPTADTCTGIRPEPGGALDAWPSEHGWLASGFAARSPIATPLLLVLRDARTREPLIGGELRPGLHGAFVLLLRVPTLERAVLLCHCDDRWAVAARADIPASARGTGFDTGPVPELRTGGWLEHGVARIPVLQEAGSELRSAELWRWASEGAEWTLGAELRPPVIPPGPSATPAAGRGTASSGTSAAAGSAAGR